VNGFLKCKWENPRLTYSLFGFSFGTFLKGHLALANLGSKIKNQARTPAKIFIFNI